MSLILRIGLFFAILSSPFFSYAQLAFTSALADVDFSNAVLYETKDSFLILTSTGETITVRDLDIHDYVKLMNIK